MVGPKCSLTWDSEEEDSNEKVDDGDESDADKCNLSPYGLLMKDL